MENQTIAEKIIGLEKAALEQWNRGNPSGYIELFAEDITYFDPFNHKRIDGREAMVAFYEGLRGQISADSYLMIDPRVQTGEDTALLTYNLESRTGEQRYLWNCTEVYRLAPTGQWQIYHNHWSFVRPMDMVWE